MEGVLEKNSDGFYSAEVDVNGDFTLVLEKDFAGPIRIDIKSAGERFALGPRSDEFTSDKALYSMDEYFVVGRPCTIRILCLTRGGDNKPTYVVNDD